MYRGFLPVLVSPADILCDDPLDYGLGIYTHFLLKQFNISMLYIIVRKSYYKHITVKPMLEYIIPDLLTVTAALYVLLQSHYERMAYTHFAYDILINGLGKARIYKAAGISPLLKLHAYLFGRSYHASESKQRDIIFLIYYFTLPEAYRSCCLRIGSYTIIRYVLEEYKLPQLLSKQFGKDCGLLLDLVAYMIVEEENAGQYYPDFAFCHPLFSEGMRKG